MGMMILILSALFALYIANVIACAIICETYEEAQLAKPYIFEMPLLTIRLFFYFLTEDMGLEIPRAKVLFLYIILPAKNLIVADCIAELCKERNRNVVFKVAKRKRLTPNLGCLADFFGTKIGTSYYLR